MIVEELLDIPVARYCVSLMAIQEIERQRALDMHTDFYGFLNSL